MSADAPTYLYLHGIDELNLQLFRHRLSQMFDIVNEAAEEGAFDGSDTCFYRQELKDEVDPGSGDMVPVYRELRASIIEMASAFRPVLRLEVVHSSCTSDFTVCGIIPEGVEIDVFDFDHILDAIERWQDAADCAFTAQGHIGQAYLDEVSRKETKAFRMLNAIVHAYIEFSEDEKFSIAVGPRKPFGPSTFHQVVGGHRFEFLSPATKAAIDKLLPSVAKLHFSAAQSVMTYWIGPTDEDDCIVEASTLPTQAALEHLLKSVTDLPLPHLLDAPEMVED